MDLIPFESAGLPAYLTPERVAEVNEDLTSHASTGFPVMSIKGKVFAVVRDGERNVLPNPRDPESPATYIEVVLVKASKGTSKIWYAKDFVEGAENVKPDCYSNEGIRPEPTVEHPVSKVCATCPKNQWGSRISDNGSKGKACADAVRMAIATADLINDPYLLRVPPASIRPLGEYGKMLAKRGVPYNAVVTRLGFDMEMATPKLTFKPLGFLTDKQYAQVQEVAKGDVVEAILGTSFAELPVEPVDPAHEAIQKAAAPAHEPAPAPVAPAAKATKTVTTDEVAAVVAKAAHKPKAAPAPTPAPAPAAAAVDVDVPGLNLDDLNFDD